MTNARLKVADEAGTLTDLQVAADAGSATGNALPTADAGARTSLAEILTALGTKLDDGGTVSLSAGTLAALEEIIVTVSGVVAISDGGGSVTVDGPLTDAELRASEIGVADATARARLADILAQLDDATTDTVLSVLKALLTELAKQQTDALTDAELRAAAVDVAFVRNLTDRMQAKSPADGYRLWFDTEDASHLYLLEAPAGTASNATGFRGIRITLGASGAPLGAVEVNKAGTLTFDNRTTDTGWAS